MRLLEYFVLESKDDDLGEEMTPADVAYSFPDAFSDPGDLPNKEKPGGKFYRSKASRKEMIYVAPSGARKTFVDYPDQHEQHWQEWDDETENFEEL